MTGIKNTSLKLTGLDTHGAGISGSLTSSVNGLTSSQSLSGNIDFSARPYIHQIPTLTPATTQSSVSTPANAKFLILTAIFVAPYNSGGTQLVFHLRQDTTNLLTLSTGTYTPPFVRVWQRIITNPTGVHTYDVFNPDTVIPRPVQNFILNLNFIIENDTHGGILTGSNTQKPQEDKIIA